MRLPVTSSGSSSAAGRPGCFSCYLGIPVCPVLLKVQLILQGTRVLQLLQGAAPNIEKGSEKELLLQPSPVESELAAWVRPGTATSLMARCWWRDAHSSGRLCGCYRTPPAVPSPVPRVGESCRPHLTACSPAPGLSFIAAADMSPHLTSPPPVRTSSFKRKCRAASFSSRRLERRSSASSAAQRSCMCRSQPCRALLH